MTSRGDAAASYELVLARLIHLRAAVAADGTNGRPIREIRRDHAALDQSLAEAVRQAFAADAIDAPTPKGVRSWVAEGLARSHERELALLAAADVSGVMTATTLPSPSWGTEPEASVSDVR